MEKKKKIVKEKDKRNLFKKVEQMKKSQENKTELCKTQIAKKINIKQIAIPVLLVMILSLALPLMNNGINNITKSTPELVESMNYATVAENESNTNSEYVQFDAFFLKDIDGDGYADKVRGTCNQVRTEDILYMELNVITNGYLENGVITINSENFYFNTAIAKDNEIKENYASYNTRRIELNRINNGTQKTISGAVRSGNYANMELLRAGAIKDKDGYSKINSITLIGTHVETLADGSTKETQIEKTVNFQVDWYGEIECDWYSNSGLKNQYNKAKKIYDEDKKELNVVFDLKLRDKSECQLLLEGIYIELTMPDINGYKPTRMGCSGYEVEYDATTGDAKLQRKYETGNRRSFPDIYNITAIYPEEAYNSIKETGKIIEIPVQAYFKGYNNPNGEYQNPYVSNKISGTLELIVEGEQAWQNMYIYDLSKKKPLRIYNGISETEIKDRYRVVLDVYTEQSTTNNGMIIKEKYENEKPVSDSFKKSDGTYDSMENITKYVGIYPGNSKEYLLENGYMKIYNDETNELIATFNKEQIPTDVYMFEEPIKHIRIETSTLNTMSNVYFYFYKELDDEYITTHYTREEFDKLEYVKSTLVTYMDNKTIETRIEELYDAPNSPLDLDLNKSAIGTQKEENISMDIVADSTVYTWGNEKTEWKNGEFLVKLPEEIMNVHINNITTDNEKVRITEYKIEEIEGSKCIRIKTQNDEEQYFRINVDIDLRANPMALAKTGSIELYGVNPFNPNYYDKAKDIYDVDENGNTEEYVGKETENITIAAPNSLLSNEKAKNYDSENSITIAPNKANISKEQRKATIAIEIKNNYENTISEVSILGKIPTVNTNYVINGTALGSTYGTTLAETGLILPEAIRGSATIYYSEQLNPSKDLELEENGWTTSPTDITKVKSFYIDLGEYVLSKEETLEITYDVNIPEGIEYNEISNAQHAVYFSLDTKDGKYKTQTEPEKLGLRIAKTYDLEITKYELDNESGKTVSGATYEIKEKVAEGEEEGETETLITQEDGKLVFNNLLVEKVYELKETKSPEGYELNTEIIEFTVEEENNEPKLVINKGTVKTQTASKDTAGKYQVKIGVEDELTANKAEPITIHHYIYDEATKSYTTNPVPLANGETAKDEVKKGKNNTSIEISALENISSEYEVYEAPEETTVTFTKEAQEYTYYYKLKGIDITVNKVWNHGNNEEGKYPSRVILQVKNGETVVSEKEVTEADNWKYSVSNLPRYDAEGKAINYTVGEKEVAKGELEFYKSEINGTTITNTYEKPGIKLETAIDKTGPEEINREESNVDYQISYTGRIEDFRGKAEITIIDTLPYEIEEGSSELQGGIYNKEAKTITWTEEIENINTFETNTAKEISITKEISLKYKYGNVNTMNKRIENKVEGTINLKEDNQIVKTESKEKNKTTEVKIPAQVTVHHYIYEKEAGEYTTSKIVEDEVKNGIVGQAYTTEKSNQVPANYICVNETPENQKGTMTKENIEVNYYYKLEESTITNEANKTSEVEVLREENGEISYKIKYTTRIENYIGEVKFIVVDELPAEIKETASKIEGGIYNKTNKTISWEERKEIDTYANGAYTYTLEKTIKLVYENQDVTKELTNKLIGQTITYYPDNYVIKAGEEKDKEEATASKTIRQEYKINKKVSKNWNDNNNAKGKRPESVVIKLTADGQKVENQEKELNEANNWEYEYTNLEKYDNTGKEIIYSIEESEKNEGDLEYYEAPQISGTKDIIVTNSYKLKETTLDRELSKETAEIITKSEQEINYTIKYKATITDYIGEVLVTIVDQLPYEIDEEKSEINGGIYNKEAKTISWTERIGHINTDTSGEAYVVNINKEIKLVYKNLDASQASLKNIATASLELYETEEKNTITTEAITEINIKGKIVEKYIDSETGEEIKERKETEAKVGEEYKIEIEEIANYDYKESIGEIEGKYTEEGKEIIHKYTKTPAKVIIKYVDEKGNEILPKETIEGYVTKEYEISRKDIENYDLIKVNGPEKGEMTKEEIEITYEYKRQEGKIIVEYIDKESGKEIAESESKIGYVGDKYETIRKEIENYQKAEPEPENKAGIVGKGETIIKYYYERIPSGKITVKYVDIETKEEIKYKNEEGEETTYSYTIEGYVGEEYKTEEKEIPYYKRIDTLKPIKGEGKLSKEDITVEYYYQKLEFNLEISKKLTEIKVNGEVQNIKENQLAKVEVHAKKIAETKVEVKYKITVRNTGEIEGTGKVLEEIPEGYSISENNAKEWQKNAQGNLEYEISLKAGESKEIEVILNWNQNQDNFGEKKNTASLINISNPAGYSESNMEDNKGEVSILMSIRTGKDAQILIIILGIIAASGSIILGLRYGLSKKSRNNILSGRY